MLELVKSISKKNLNLKVLCKKDSWVRHVYEKTGIKSEVVTFLPIYTVLDTVGKNLYSLFFFFSFTILRFFLKKKTIKNLLKNIDIIHLNHSNLWFLAIWIKQNFPATKVTIHIRTLPYKNIFSKLQYKLILKYTDKQIFITNNEYIHFKELAGAKPSKIIIYNSVDKSKTNKNKYAYLKKNKEFLIGSFSNYSFYRGTDRIIEVVSFLNNQISKKIKFIIAGDIKIPNGAKNQLKHLKPFNDLKEYTKAKGLSNRFLFLGHIEDVENILVHLDLTLKLTREYNPWGRDILESMFYSVPVVSIGKYSTFVKNKHTGILLQKYSPQNIANQIAYLYKNKNKLFEMKKNSKKVILDKCNPRKNSEKIYKLWLNL